MKKPWHNAWMSVTAACLAAVAWNVWLLEVHRGVGNSRMDPALLATTSMPASETGALLSDAAGRHPGAKAGEEASAQTMRVLAATDEQDSKLGELEAELRRAAGLPDGDERRDALVAVCMRWAQHDPADAIALAARLELGDGPGDVMENLTHLWAKADFGAASAWVTNQPVGEKRDHLFARVAFVRSQTEPIQAARLVAEQIAPGPAQEEASISVLHQWAQRDLGSAFAWVERFPEGPLRDRALQELEGIAGGRLASRSGSY